MPAAPDLHPTPAELRGFAQGRLTPTAMSQIEQHVAACDSCCAALAKVPDDTLVQLAREAATQGFRADEKRTKSAPKPPLDIPPELRDHPRYRVLGLVGVGGMGAVYKAEHRLMKRLVALKTISPAFLSNAAAVARFRNEFQSTARLSHPNVVTAFDADQAGELHFLVMEFVEGMPLDRLVAQRGRLPIEQACQVFRQAAEGLAHIHEKRLVHRDIKPQNLMVGRSGVKILDCGLARPVSDSPHKLDKNANDPAQPHATSAGMILGTPDYIAPEQCADARSADIRSDIYSLGCTFYFALTGQPPFPHRSAVEKLAAHSTIEPASLASLRPEVPAELERIVARMMAKDPAKRFQTPSDLARDLAKLEQDASADGAEALLAVEPAAATMPVLTDRLFDVSPDALGNLPVVQSSSSPSKPAFRAPSLPVVLLASGAALVLAIAAFALAGYFGGPSERPVAKNSAAKNAESASKQAGIPPVVPISIPTPPLAAPPKPLPKKVLMVIPSKRRLWYPDFANVKSSLEAEGIELVIGSSDRGPSSNVNDSAQGVVYPDIILTQPGNPEEYGAIIFVGFDTTEYHPGSDMGDCVGKIIEALRDRGRLVTAICAGQRALAAHGALRGKKVAYSDHTRQAEGYVNSGATLLHEKRVHRDGQIITAASEHDARGFVDAIAAGLRGE
jgi:serine/threonine protein kinase